MNGIVGGVHDEGVAKPPLDLRHYRESPREQARIASLFRLLPARGESALDVGARDGFLTRLLAERFDRVTALDLTKPSFAIDRVETVAGDVTRLAFADGQFDVVLCAEVLEHIPPSKLQLACKELARVARKGVLIGVPYKQDLRSDRTTCVACGGVNPPWGHVNSFDEAKIRTLFAMLPVNAMDFVGETKARTNALSVALMDFARNPWGTYNQEESCVHCARPLTRPHHLSVAQKICAALAIRLTEVQRSFSKPTANWIHVLFGSQP